MSIPSGGFVKPGKVYVHHKLCDFPMRIILWLIFHFSFEDPRLLSLASEPLVSLRCQHAFSVGQQRHTPQHLNASVGFQKIKYYFWLSSTATKKSWSKSEFLSSKLGQITPLKESKQLSQIIINCSSKIEKFNVTYAQESQ